MAWAAAEADGRVQVGAGRPKLGNNSQIIADPRVYFAKQFGSNVTAPCGRITHGVISGATPHPEPPMPLQLNDEEMSVLMSLAGPIDQQRRPQFLQEVAQELEVKRQAGEVGEGLGASPGASDSTEVLGPAADFAQRDGARAPRSRRLRA
jgi:hypothetical protein